MADEYSYELKWKILGELIARERGKTLTNFFSNRSTGLNDVILMMRAINDGVFYTQMAKENREKTIISQKTRNPND